MKVTENVHVFGQFERICLITGDQGHLLVDCGAATWLARNLAEITDAGFRLEDIKGILVTHCHWDHVGGLRQAREKLGCPALAHELEAEAIETGDPLLTAAHMPFLPDGVNPFPPCPVDVRLRDGDEITLGSLRLTAHHVPGHTPGGLAFSLGDLLFVGDTLLPPGAVGWNDIHWGSCYEDYLKTLKRIVELKPRLILPGHGEPTEFTENVIRHARKHLRALIGAGGAPAQAKPALRKLSREPARTISLPAPQRPTPPPNDLPLSRAVLHEFRSGALRGFVRPEGPMHGLGLFGPGGEPIIEPGRCGMNLEHYFCAGAAGPFIPRHASLTRYEVRPDRLRIEFLPHQEWALRAFVEYVLRDGATVEVTFTFEFERAFPAFEAFVASYFHGERLPQIYSSEGWLGPEVAPKEHLFFPRDENARAMIHDGRWDFLKPNLFAGVAKQCYAAPLTLHWLAQPGWALMQMADPALCPAISCNTFAYAQDFSLVGKDVEAGESVEARLRVALREIGGPDQALKEYEGFLRDLG